MIPQRRRSIKALSFLAAAMLLVTPLILLAACAQTVSQQEPLTPLASSPTATTAPLASDATPTPGPFVCAKPASRNSPYAYVVADGQLTLVRDCYAVEIPGRGGRLLAPQAFSPDGSWLLASEGLHDPMATPNTPTCDALINTVTGAQTLTPLCDIYPADSTRDWFGFIGWSDNSTYYDAGWGSGNDTAVKLYRVRVPSLSVTSVATLSWVGNLANQRTTSGMVLRNNTIYYAGYASTRDHNHASLRRYSLATGQDMPVVSLGIAGTGGCQVQVDNTPCLWAGPWDITGDGRQIAYHNPGPTQSPSDTYNEPGTPLNLATSDGSAPSELFPGAASVSGFLSPSFSPDGAYITTLDASRLAFERLGSRTVVSAPDSYRFPEWTATPGYVVLYDESPSGDYQQHPVLYNIETGAQLRLQAGSFHYVWASTA